MSAIKLDVVGMKGELAILRWMMGFLLAMVTTLLFKAFAHRGIAPVASSPAKTP